MNLRKCGLVLLFSGACLWLYGQSARQEIAANVRLSASNYCAYVVPDVAPTPAPEGYRPVYISTYARHGSRFLINPKEYTAPLRTLQRADSAGVLTPMGRRVLQVVDSLERMARGRYGELTPLGARQHQGIASRMYRHYPEVFAGQAWIDARSTPVPRCILSMLNECTTLKGLNNSLRLTTDASVHDMYYMNDDAPSVKRYRKEPEARASRHDFERNKVKPARLMKALFSNAGYVSRQVDGERLMNQLFDLASNMQSHDTDLDLYFIFTPDECYDLWLCNNYDWYVNYGPSPLTKGMMPLTQANLLRNILDVADTCLARPTQGATLRFGHEVCVLPLACLMELDDAGRAYRNADSVALAWRNYKIFPMASNLQLVFYRNAGGDVLVKALLNEREMRLPVEPVRAPYYRWADVERYYRHKLQAMQTLLTHDD